MLNSRERGKEGKACWKETIHWPLHHVNMIYTLGLYRLPVFGELICGLCPEMCGCFCITGTVQVSAMIAQKRPKGSPWIMELMLLSYGEHGYRMAGFLSGIEVRIGKTTFVNVSNLKRSFVVKSASSVACGGTARKMISLQPPQSSSPLYLFFGLYGSLALQVLLAPIL